MGLKGEEKADKQRLAKDYYLYSPYTQAEIAKRSGVSEQTLSNWIDSLGWKTLRDELMRVADQRIRQYAKLVDWMNRKLEEEDLDVDQLYKLQNLLDRNAPKQAEASAVEKVGIALIQFLDERMPERRDHYLDFYRAFAEWYGNRNQHPV
jgi:uncharacterized protein YjcR